MEQNIQNMNFDIRNPQCDPIKILEIFETEYLCMRAIITFKKIDLMIWIERKIPGVPRAVKERMREYGEIAGDLIEIWLTTNHIILVNKPNSNSNFCPYQIVRK